MKDDDFHIALSQDARWLLHQYDPVTDQALWLGLDRSVYRNSLFLDQRMALPSQPEQRVTPLWSTLAELRSQPCHGLFHMSHCGSTLLSRLLDASTDVLGLREPLALKALAALRRDLESPLAVLDPERYPALERGVMAALARSFANDRIALVKGTSDTGNLAAAFLDQHPDNRLLLMTLTLEPFLATVLRSNLRRQETWAMAAARLADLHPLGLEDLRLYRLKPGELAALNWLGNAAPFARLVEDERVQALEFEAFLDAPLDGLMMAAEHLGLQPDSERAKAALAGPIMAAYSKDPGMRYGQSERNAELARCRDRFGDEIRQGLDWIHAALERAPGLQGVGRWLGG